jgi:hypothetical protein
VKPEAQIHQSEPKSGDRYRAGSSGIARRSIWMSGVKEAEEVGEDETRAGDEGIGNKSRERPSYDAGQYTEEAGHQPTGRPGDDPRV